MGTPDFISPEQSVDAHQADIRSDIYSLGATLYYLLSGQPPFSSGGVAERLKHHVETVPVPVNQLRNDVPQDLADVVSRMLEKAPADRYQDPKEVESALNSLDVNSAKCQPETPQATVSRLPRALMALAGVAVAALLAVVIYVETDKGTLAIETMDENVKVTIKKASDSAGDEYLNLEVVDTVTGSSVSRLRSGAYKVSLDDESNQYQLDQDGFTLSRGGKVVVTVSRAPQAKIEAPLLVKMPIPRSAQQKFTSMGHSLSKDEALELQSKVDEDPTEVASRLKLLGYYFGKSIMNAELRVPQVKLIRWFVENYPENAGDTEMGIHASINPEGYIEIKKLWLEQIEQYPSNTKIMGNVANFVRQSDPDLAETLLNKAKKLEPEDPQWAERLARGYQLRMIGERNKQKRKELAEKSLEQFELAIELTGDSMKASHLRESAAKAALVAGETEKAQAYAETMLKASGDAKSDWNYGNRIYDGNHLLGQIALAAGDIDEAKSRLIKAAQTPGSPQLNSFGPSMLLAKKLLEAGETEVVLEYFELCGEFWKKPQLKQWAKTVKGGGIPDFGQHLTR